MLFSHSKPMVQLGANLWLRALGFDEMLYLYAEKVYRFLLIMHGER